ncbi:hypothetical protein D3C87_1622530 [compost metagenome]
MKLTWFGGSTFRVQIGGQVVAIDPQSAPAGIDQGELVSGADRVVTFGESFAAAEALTWRPRAAERLVDAGDTMRPVRLWTVGPGSLLIEGDDEMPLLFLDGPVPALGRWGDSAVVVLLAQGLAARAAALFEARSPRLVALAGGESEVGEAFEAVRPMLDGTGLVALEPGLAVEA